MTDTPRVLFLGTPDFAVPTLLALADGACDVVAVVTQPDRPKGRVRSLAPSPVKQAALARGLPVLQPERIRTEASLKSIACLRPDVLVTAAYGQILPQRLLDLPTVGSLNVHASLLPRWRGAAPIHRAILAGDAETGVTLMEMVAALDAGPMYAQVRVPIHDEDDVGSLHDRLAAAGARLLLDLLPAYAAGDCKPEPQPEEGITYANRISRVDEWMDWQRSARDLHNQIRGLSPWPGAVTRLAGREIKLWRADLTPPQAAAPDREPGRIWAADEQVWVGCADGWVRLLDVQPAGRQRMTAADWWRGLPTGQEHRFDEPPPDNVAAARDRDGAATS